MERRSTEVWAVPSPRLFLARGNDELPERGKREGKTWPGKSQISYLPLRQSSGALGRCPTRTAVRVVRHNWSYALLSEHISISVVLNLHADYKFSRAGLFWVMAAPDGHPEPPLN
eukprot:7233240-Pyramimonas_sp.AAC.1